MCHRRSKCRCSYTAQWASLPSFVRPRRAGDRLTPRVDDPAVDVGLQAAERVHGDERLFDAQVVGLERRLHERRDEFRILVEQRIEPGRGVTVVVLDAALEHRGRQAELSTEIRHGRSRTRDDETKVGLRIVAVGIDDEVGAPPCRYTTS